MHRRLPALVRRAACFLLLLLGAEAGVVGADSAAAGMRYTWRNVEIKGGGFVTGLVFHPREPHLLYARTDVGGAYRWDEARRRWLPLSDALGRDAAELLGVLSLARDPEDANRVYLACGSYTASWAKPAALLASVDYGVSWQRVDLPFKLGGNEEGRSTGERLQVDPKNGAVLLLGTSGDGLWRSDDRASTWRRGSSFPGKRVTFVLFALSRARAEPEIFVGAADPDAPTLYRSRDGGKTWTPLPEQPRGLIVHHAACDARGPLYLAGANGLGPNGISAGAVWKFAPDTAQWTDITPRRPDAEKKDVFGYAGLAIEGQDARVLVVSTLDRWHEGDEIFRSTDGGATWRPLLAGARWDAAAAPYVQNLKPHWIGALAIDPAQAERLWCVTGYGVWTTGRSDAVETGEATSWVFADDGLEETVVNELVSPSAGTPLISAVSDLGGFRHDDVAASPAAGMFLPVRGGSPWVAVAAERPTTVVRTHFGSARGAVSDDGGRAWRDFAATPAPARSNGPGAIAISADARRLVWLPKGARPYFSTDAGASWTESDTELVSSREFEIDEPVADAAEASSFFIYAHERGLVYASRDGGQHFTAVAHVPAGGGTLRVEPGRTGIVWLPTNDGLFRSLDAGRTFVRLPLVAEAHQVGFGCAAPGQSRVAIYLHGKINGVTALFRSDDGGETWSRITETGQRFGWIRSLTGDLRVPGRVYIGTGGRGILYGDPMHE